jgi:hypothetical protein
VKLKKTLKTLSSGQKNPKNPKKIQKTQKTQKTPKNQKKKTHWAGFFFKKPGFFQPCVVPAALPALINFRFI